MNLVLAAYYGTVPREKVSSPEANELVSLRELDVRIRNGEKVSSADAGPVGGLDQALKKLSAGRSWLDAWEEGEQEGRRLARAGMEAIFEQAFESP